MIFKKDYTKLLEITLQEMEKLNYAEQFLDLFPDFFSKQFPVPSLAIFILNQKNTNFIPYLGEKYSSIQLEPVTWNSNIIIYLKNSQKTIILKNETPSRIGFLKKTNPDLFDKLKIDIIIPLFSLKKLHGFAAIEANSKIYKELDHIERFFKIYANILIPLIMGERTQGENNQNYYKIYRMDRLALVGELAASAAHEIKNPLAGISTFLKYFSELEDYKKKDIGEEVELMRHLVQRIDEIVKSLLSFSRHKRRETGKVSLMQIVDSSLNSMALKIPENIKIVKKFTEDLIIETDSQQIEQIIINILFNALDAIGKERTGEIVINIYVSGRDQLPSKELFNISIKDNGPGIDEYFKEKLFQPFQTTKEEGTGLGLYTCYGLMKSLGGNIKIESSPGSGTEVILSLPYSFEDEE
ncbi:MAG TPA: HAMP domain-containing sensor histidine kinase [Candidatus Kapabacteria bacterium]|nr:HAMP domain-containing sensor histidine kinase [Candidatus Kapabacteria bacterium]